MDGEGGKQDHAGENGRVSQKMKAALIVWWLMIVPGGGKAFMMHSIQFDSMASCLKARPIVQKIDERIQTVCVETQVLGGR